MRFHKASILAFLVLVGFSSLFVFFGHLHSNVATHKPWTDNIVSFSNNHIQRIKHQDNGSQLSEIAQLLRQLHGKLVVDNENIEQVNNVVGSNKDKGLSTNDGVPKLLPLDYTRVLNKTVGDLDSLMITPTKIPDQPRGVSMYKMPYMMDPNYRHTKCPKTIGSITKYSSWFKQRYKPGLKMWLDETDVYNWDNYHKLRHYGMPFGLASVDRKILGKIVNSRNFTNAPLTDTSGRCVRCAVIGSGGILNGSNAGAEIDSHDYVFRVNHAYTSDKYVKDVGQKTSFYEFFPESQHVSTVRDPTAAFLFTNFKKSDLYYAEGMLRGATNNRTYIIDGKPKDFFKPPAIDPKRLKITHPDFFRYVFTHFLDLKGYRPTTGALVVFTAIYLCDEVTIYGFGYDPRFTMHYYDRKFVKHTPASTGSHDVDNERELWHKLHTEGVIKLFKRDI